MLGSLLGAVAGGVRQRARRDAGVSRSAAAWLVLVALSLVAGTASAQAGRRVALLVGNAAYEAEKPLKNPINDANAIAEVLRKDLGFNDVEVITNARRRELIDAVARFGEAARGADAAFFYFSGHGQQQGRANFLLPVDARIERPEHVKAEGLDADDVLSALEAAKPRVSLMVLDACRDNPFAARTRSSSKGLTRPRDPEEGTLIAFATRDGETALDGTAGNSPYAQALVSTLKRARTTPIQQMFDDVSDQVKRATDGKQRPIKYGDLKVNVYLVNPTIVINNPSSDPAQTQAQRREDDARKIEDEAWADAAKADRAAAYDAYLAGYPGGRYVARARIALARLRDAASASQTAAPASTVQSPTPTSGYGTTSYPSPLVGNAGTVFSGATVDTIRARGTIRLGYRAASVPLSFMSSDGKPIGYSIDICRRVVDALGASLGRTPKIEYVEVTSANRIPLVESGAVDLECGSTTNNRSRQQRVSFSSSIFLFSSRIATRTGSSINDWSDLAGKTVVVTTGTNSEALIKSTLGSAGTTVRFLAARDHNDAFAHLSAGRAEAFVMDDVILARQIAASARPGDFRITGTPKQIEPIGLMFRQDAGFKSAVDSVVGEMSRAGDLQSLYRQWLLNALPDGVSLNLPASNELGRMLRAPNDRDFVQ